MTQRSTDSIEQDYERAIAIAAAKGGNDRAYELSTGLRQYRGWYRDWWRGHLEEAGNEQQR